MDREEMKHHPLIQLGRVSRRGETETSKWILQNEASLVGHDAAAWSTLFNASRSNRVCVIAGLVAAASEQPTIFDIVFGIPKSYRQSFGEMVDTKHSLIGLIRSSCGVEKWEDEMAKFSLSAKQSSIAELADSETGVTIFDIYRDFNMNQTEFIHVLCSHIYRKSFLDIETLISGGTTYRYEPKSRTKEELAALDIEPIRAAISFLRGWSPEMVDESVKRFGNWLLPESDSLQGMVFLANTGRSVEEALVSLPSSKKADGRDSWRTTESNLMLFEANVLFAAAHY